jgi:Chromate transporter
VLLLDRLDALCDRQLSVCRCVCTRAMLWQRMAAMSGSARPRMQVVLPMLSSEVVSTGWMSESDFLTGLALIQALPGPLFNLSAYIGAQDPGLPSCLPSCTHHPDDADLWTGQPAADFKLVQPTCRHGLTNTGAGAIVALNAGYASIIGIAVCWLGLFLPGILMIYAVLPWWGAFRNVAVYRRCVTRCCIAVTHALPDVHLVLTCPCALCMLLPLHCRSALLPNPADRGPLAGTT